MLSPDRMFLDYCPLPEKVVYTDRPNINVPVADERSAVFRVKYLTLQQYRLQGIRQWIAYESITDTIYIFDPERKAT